MPDALRFKVFTDYQSILFQLVHPATELVTYKSPSLEGGPEMFADIEVQIPFWNDHRIIPMVTTRNSILTYMQHRIVIEVIFLKPVGG
jgi:hypothetical protein